MRKWIKQCLLGGFLAILSVGEVLATVPLMKNPQTLKYLDIELPFRCSSEDVSVGEKVTSSVALSNLDFTVRLPGQSGVLPRYYVNGFSFKNKTADVAVKELLKETGIKVVPEEGKYPTLSACELKGELFDVLEELMRQGAFFYTYQANDNTLFLTHKAKAIIQVPRNEFVMMAVIDALNGGHFEPISVDWSNFQITLIVSRPELKNIQELMANLIKEKYILSAQMDLYALHSNGRNTHWQKIVDRLNSKLSSVQNGLIGQVFSLAQGVDDFLFLKEISNFFSVGLIASGKIVVPSGWRTRFNFNQCSNQIPYPDLSVFMKTSVKKKNTAHTVLTIDSANGEVASFDINNNLDQKVIIVGIPVPGKNGQELAISLKFQFIQLIKKGEQNE